MDIKECFLYLADKLKTNIFTREYENSYYQYMILTTCRHTPEEFEKIQEDLKAEDSVKKETARALEQFISLPEQKIAPGETDRILEDLTREYHRSTGS